MFPRLPKTLLILGISAAFVAVQAAEPAAAGSKIRLLIFSGANDHDWKATKRSDVAVRWFGALYS